MTGTNVTNIDTAKWTTTELDKFIELMIDNVKKGNKTSSTFNREGWADIKTRLEAFTGRTYIKDQLRNKLNKLRVDYGAFKNLLAQSGGGWDRLRRTADVGDESVWERLLQANPTWAKFKRNGLPYYTELQMIFGDSYAQGTGATSQAYPAPIPEVEHGVDTEVEASISNNPMGLSLEESNQSGQEASYHSSGRHRLDRTPSGLRKRSRTAIVEESLEAFSKLCFAKLEQMTSACTSASPSISIGPTVVPIDTSTYACTILLNTIVDLPRELYVKAVQRIRADPEWRQSFIASPEDKRIWLIYDDLN